MILLCELQEVRRSPGQTEVPLNVDRRTLAKKLWRGRAVDGTEFGFELSSPMAPDTAFYQISGHVYVVKQEPEPILIVALPSSRDDAARLGWKMGNLHVPVQVDAGRILVADDPGMRQNLERQHIVFSAAQGIFRPLSPGHSHGHDEHPHDH